MLYGYDLNGGSLVKREGLAAASPAAVWFDLVDPTAEEEAWVEGLLKIDVPTRAEVREIEASSRFYEESGATVMTAFILHSTEQQTPATSTLTFILTGDKLVTVRYSEPKAFPMFAQRAALGSVPCGSGPAIMAGILETVIQRMADFIERIQDSADKLAHGIFSLKSERRDSTRRLDVLLRNIGKEGDAVARALESATSLDRLLHYFKSTATERNADAKVLHRIDVAQKDIQSLMEHTRFLTTRTSFLLEATLGTIANEQNQIIKLFSVMAVMLMPPTLVASVYGMNFVHMPEIHWPYGYPIALGLMFLSALVPFIYFKRKGWL